jgi:hypothetical protein
LETLFEQSPVVVELLRGLIEVPSVGSQSSLVMSDDSSSSRAREARDVFYGSC